MYSQQIVTMLFLAILGQTAALIKLKQRRPVKEHVHEGGKLKFSVKPRPPQNIENVAFQLISPDGQETRWMNGSPNPSGKKWNLKQNISGPPGMWQWRIEAVAKDGEIILSRLFNFKVEPILVTDEIIENAKEDILALTSNNVPLKAKFLRLGFHDCIGGCDGCVDLQEPDNNGLEIPIAALESVVATFAGSLSRADVWALATIVGAESSQRGRDSLDYTFDFTGRVDCEDTGVDVCVNVASGCDPSRNGPVRDMPSANLNTAEMLHFFSSEFGFGAEETVALMGAHTIGEAVREHSGFDGKWVRDNERLDNLYYRDMIGGNRNMNDWFDAPNWNQRRITNNNPDIPTRTQWRRGGGNNEEIMLNADIALVRDFDGRINTADGRVSCQFRNQNSCPAAGATIAFMAKFKFSNSEWLSAFRDVLTKMVQNGYSNSVKEHSKTNIFDHGYSNNTMGNSKTNIFD